jgi:hypothetical protein
MNNNLLEISRVMLSAVIARGQTPLAFIMAESTAGEIAQLAYEADLKRQSALKRMISEARFKGHAPKLESLHGLPVVLHPKMAPGNMALQTTGSPHAALAMPPGNEANVGQQQANAAADQIPPEFVRREKVAAGPAEDEVRPTLDDFSSSGSDRPSCSDVLIKAMTDIDKVAGVIVIRVYPNEDIDMGLNIGGNAAQGVLMKAMHYLQMRGM